MIRIATEKHVLYALILTLALSACDMAAHAPVSSAYAQPANSILWPEVSPGAVADGNVEMYY